MNQNEFLSQLCGHLESAQIPYMVAGSVGSSYYGQPRNTNDLDLVIDPTLAQLDQFLNLLGKAYYVSRETVREALARCAMFNVIHLAEGWKADLIVRKDRAFSVEEFQRRATGNIQGRAIAVASAEDIILSKLEWNLITPSERQVQDALNVVIARWSSLDREYLRKWAEELGVTDSLEAVLRAAEEAQPLP